jgi:hypothetical protein
VAEGSLVLALGAYLLFPRAIVLAAAPAAVALRVGFPAASAPCSSDLGLAQAEPGPADR